MPNFVNKGTDEQTVINSLCKEQVDMSGAIEHLDYKIKKHTEKGELDKAEVYQQIKTWLLELKHSREKVLSDTLEEHTDGTSKEKDTY